MDEKEPLIYKDSKNVLRCNRYVSMGIGITGLILGIISLALLITSFATKSLNLGIMSTFGIIVSVIVVLYIVFQTHDIVPYKPPLTDSDF